MGQAKGEPIGKNGSGGEAVDKRQRARSTSPTPEEVKKAQSRTVRDCRHHMACPQAECTHLIWRRLINSDIYDEFNSKFY